jgi:hypothetical protein
MQRRSCSRGIITALLYVDWTVTCFLQEYTRNSQIRDANFTVGPFRDDIAVVR